MPSNNFSFALANRQWDLLSKEGVHDQLFTFDKVVIIVLFIQQFVSLIGFLTESQLDLTFGRRFFLMLYCMNDPCSKPPRLL